MKIGFHYHIPATIKDGKIWTPSYQGVFIDSLASRFEKVICFLHNPAPSELSIIDYPLRSSNVEWVDLGIHNSIPQRLIRSNKIAKIVADRAGEIDILLLRGPSPVLPVIISKCYDKTKIALLVVGNMLDHIDSIKQPAWRKFFLRQYIVWNETRQREWAKKSLVFVNSDLAYEHYKPIASNLVKIKTTTLSKNDFYVRPDTCLHDTVQLLYTGRIEETKGVIDMLEAIALLKKEGINVVLNLVGWSNPKDDIIERLKQRSRELGMENNIVFHGKKTLGLDLFDQYKNADIFIIASQVAEGFPRVIWEALAHSMPVLATPVGSIPYFLKDGHDILTIKQKSPEDIAAKIKLLVNDGELRRSLIKNGLDTVSEVTLEVQSERMYDTIENYVSTNQ